MKEAKDLLPWKVTDISIRPYDGFWSMNPSIHFDGSLWRCVLRCCDYAMPDGKTIRSPKAGPGHQSKNVMVIFDPDTWKPARIYKMHERDGASRVACANVGYEDMRIFRTDRGGLQGIAASLHLDRGSVVTAAGGAKNQPPEQVLLSFDEEYNIVKARPIRGDWWSGSPQKNWVPFDHCTEPRFLYSIDRGTLFDDRGALGDGGLVTPSINSLGIVSIMATTAPMDTAPSPVVAAPAPPPVPAPLRERARETAPRSQHPDLRTRIRGADAQVVRGRRIAADSSTAVGHRSFRRVNTETSNGTIGTGRVLPPKYKGLRGGSQLLRVGDDVWLGVGHEMQFLQRKKYYWHVFYTVDSKGKMLAASEPMKLVSNGIEFAAGMAIESDRLLISFGVDDMECKIGETRLSAVMEKLRSVPH